MTPYQRQKLEARFDSCIQALRALHACCEELPGTGRMVQGAIGQVIEAKSNSQKGPRNDTRTEELAGKPGPA